MNGVTTKKLQLSLPQQLAPHCWAPSPAPSWKWHTSYVHSGTIPDALNALGQVDASGPTSEWLCTLIVAGQVLVAFPPVGQDWPPSDTAGAMSSAANTAQAIGATMLAPRTTAPHAAHGAPAPPPAAAHTPHPAPWCEFFCAEQCPRGLPRIGDSDKFSLTGHTVGGRLRSRESRRSGLAGRQLGCPALRVALRCLTFGLAAEHGTAAAGAGCC